MHGSDLDNPLRPTGRTSNLNATAEQVTSVFGTASGSSITSIGFNTSRGRTFGGPWGAGGGEPFQVDGQVLGFFGALNNGAISGVGVWYTLAVASGVPASLAMSPAYGALRNVWTWDDRPDLGGARRFF
jgi:hypothetical protein